MLASVAFGWQLGIWHGVLMAHLREQHPETWHSLGRPHSAWAGWTFTTLTFLLSRRFEHLGDPQFSAGARRFRAGFVLWPIVGIAVVVFDGWLLPR